MPRANRYVLPGLVWHITHRCHRQQFLLKFQRDRANWRRWLFEARKRYGLCVLNYIATSNHIHLLVLDTGRNEIPAAMRLVAGRTAQAYNRRKSRKGAFWEDRYHATAVETGEHLARCLVYIDLNMVRAGVVRHPDQWGVSGYHEIQTPPARYRAVDREALARTLELPSIQSLAVHHRQWVEEALTNDRCSRDDRWTRSIGVGSEAFVAQLKQQLGLRALDRTVTVDDDAAFIAEDPAPYAAISPPKSSF
ncbi:transposase [Thioalkalivibrio sp. AKL19]|uniref:transposase n=1 Tax=Thioalkalivibrio sp. AKL19 TaxID=1266914 RepID=UPI0004137445|nr:transposase [Thioalkalivibrio sp. AKL19]